MYFRLILYVMVGYFIFRVIQVAGRMMSGGGRPTDGGEGRKPPPPEPRIPDFKDIKDAEFIDLTPKEKDDPKSP